MRVGVAGDHLVSYGLVPFPLNFMFARNRTLPNNLPSTIYKNMDVNK